LRRFILKLGSLSITARQ